MMFYNRTKTHVMYNRYRLKEIRLKGTFGCKEVIFIPQY